MSFLVSGGPRRQGPLTPVIKGIAAGVGLASESIHYHNEKKNAKKATAHATEVTESVVHNPPSELKSKDFAPSIEMIAEEDLNVEMEKNDEEQWALDEAQDELISAEQKHEERPSERDPMKMTKRFIDAYPMMSGVPLERLSLPVILPQRRPKNRTRGFIRAYAPELHKCGIDQAMFIDFLETFNKATLASPWLDAINLASLAFVTLPTAVSQAASIAIAIAVEVAKTMQSRHRQSNILDQMNADFYRPRGLYALILTWNPESVDMKIGVNLNETISKNLSAPEGFVQKAKHSLRPSMGNTNGVPFAESAPLVFPELDSLAANNHHGSKTTKEKFVRAREFVAEYFDRRAQAKYAGKNPDSHLIVGPKPTFTSRYSDPNNSSNDGSLVSLLSAGRLSLPQRGASFGGCGYYGGGPLGRALSDRGMYLQHVTGYTNEYGSGRGGFQNASEYDQQQACAPYQDQHHLDQMRGYQGSMTGQGVGFGGPTLLQQGIKRVLRKVS